MMIFGRILLAAVVALAPGSVWSNPLDEAVQLRVLPGWQTEAGTRMAGLHITLAPGWKTYWRAPGDAGIPPVFTWSGSRNVAAVETHWPRPSIFDTAGMRSVGYVSDFVLPLEVTPKRAGAPMAVRGQIDMGVCEAICVPVSLSFRIDLSGAGASDPLIHGALAQLPLTGAEAGVRAARCGFAPISDGLRLTAEIEMPRIGRHEAAVVEAGDARIWVSPAEVERRGGRLLLQADLVPPRGTPANVERGGLRFTILGDRHAVDIQGCRAQN